MAEAEDVIVDVARHATAYAQQRLKAAREARQAREAVATGRSMQALMGLAALAARLDLLLSAVHGRSWRIAVAQPPAPPTLLARWLGRQPRPMHPACGLPHADAATLWLPADVSAHVGAKASGASSAPSSTSMPPMRKAQVEQLYRAMALQQAQRAIARPSGLSGLSGLSDEPRTTLAWLHGLPPLACDLALVLEARRADAALLTEMPGLRPALQRLRDVALRRRPPMERLPPPARMLEAWVRDHMLQPLEAWPAPRTGTTPAEALRGLAAEMAASWPPWMGLAPPMAKDLWTGDWPPEDFTPLHIGPAAEAPPDTPDDPRPVRSAHLERRPDVRQPKEEEDDAQPGAWMIQTAQPHEHAEDPAGLQRPADRDTDAPAESHAESLADLQAARLVRSAQPAHEVLLSDDPPPRGVPVAPSQPTWEAEHAIAYPEWDHRLGDYRDPGTQVFTAMATEGPMDWVTHTLKAQQGLHQAIRRRFEMLRAQRVTLHRQIEGDEPDVDAWIQARADLRAGMPMSQRLYRSSRLSRRDCAVLVLVDISGSTDAWIHGQRRIIDVEREALLALSMALDHSGDPHAVLAFSGHGPAEVRVRTVKRFDERHSDGVARRIAGLEPERYTRAGAALRHASQVLASRPAAHQLLVLLSDGKPNDADVYEGRYGIEDTRQAVREATAIGQSLFCLTVDRQAHAYLPRIFGAHQHALLQRPERLPVVLLDWMARLMREA